MKTINFIIFILLSNFATAQNFTNEKAEIRKVIQQFGESIIKGVSAYENEPGFSFEHLSEVINPSYSMKKHELIIDDGLPDTSLLSADLVLNEYRKSLNHPVLKK